MPTLIPTGSQRFDLRDGNNIEIFTVNHVTGTTTDIAVNNSAISCAVLHDDITSSVVPIQEVSTALGITVRDQTSGATGLSFGDWAADDGLKQVTIHTDVVSGTYIVVVRSAGSAAGAGSSVVSK